jgi:hypothetical protein
VTALEVLLAVAGVAMTVLVVAGMILITPHALVDVNGDATDPQGSDLSRADPRGASRREDERRVGDAGPRA